MDWMQRDGFFQHAATLKEGGHTDSVGVLHCSHAYGDSNLTMVSLGTIFALCGCAVLLHATVAVIKCRDL